VECHTNSANSTLELLERQWSAKGNAEKSAPARLGYTVEEAGVALGIGRTAAYKAATTGELPTIRMGRRLIVPLPALHRLLEMRGRLPFDTVE
jgi:excisionase family DNA binding protein